MDSANEIKTYGIPSKRFCNFVFFKCREYDYGSGIIAPEWAIPVYKQYRRFLIEYDRLLFFRLAERMY